MSIQTRKQMKTGNSHKTGNSFSQVNQSDANESRDGEMIDNEQSVISMGEQPSIDMSHITHSVLLSEQTNQSMIQKPPMTQEAMEKMLKQLKELPNKKEGQVLNDTQVDSSLNLSLANFNLSNAGNGSGHGRPIDFSQQQSFTFENRQGLQHPQSQSVLNPRGNGESVESSASPLRFPNQPKVDTRGSNVIRNLDDDDDVLDISRLQRQQQQEIEEEDKDALMVERNQKKRDRREYDLGAQSQQQLSYRPGTQWRDQNEYEDEMYARQGGMSGMNYRDQHYQPTKITVTRSQLMGVMKSKLDIYNILSKEGQFYLPPFIECNMLFIKDILNGKKKVFRNEEIKMIDVPYFAELSAKAVFEEVRQAPRFQRYLPDLEQLKRPLNRQYLFNIVNTLDPNFFIENIRAGYEQRKIRQVDKSEMKMEIDEELYHLLRTSNQVVHNRGRALAYLGNAERKRDREAAGLNGVGGIQQPASQRQRHRYEQRVGLQRVIPSSLDQNIPFNPTAQQHAQQPSQQQMQTSHSLQNDQQQQQQPLIGGQQQSASHYSNPSSYAQRLQQNTSGGNSVGERWLNNLQKPFQQQRHL